MGDATIWILVAVLFAILAIPAAGEARSRWRGWRVRHCWPSVSHPYMMTVRCHITSRVWHEVRYLFNGRIVGVTVLDDEVDYAAHASERDAIATALRDRLVRDVAVRILQDAQDWVTRASNSNPLRVPGGMQDMGRARDAAVSAQDGQPGNPDKDGEP